MLGMLAGDTLQTGPGRAYKDGSLGCIGCGAVLQAGPGYAYKDGSLGGPMATGPGRAHRDGSLGAVRRLRRTLSGLGLLTLSPDLLLGLGIGIGGAYLFLRSRPR